MSTTPHAKLHKSKNRVIGGVCAGLGEHFGVDVTLVRVLFVLLTLMTGTGIVLYILLWILMPEEETVDVQGTEVIANGLKSVGSDINRIGDELKNRKKTA